ncbi:hypothetical protein N431DRAFT_475705 [Stipitochalara longipes BDJ]|nr:hypothetical protein N431DRAFT_475705 [Stipitochalara longipes BDJ]
MSARSDPSAVVSGDATSGSTEKDTMSPMLERYLASSPTMAEKLLLSSTPKTTAEVIVDKMDGRKA